MSGADQIGGGSEVSGGDPNRSGGAGSGDASPEQARADVPGGLDTQGSAGKEERVTGELGVPVCAAFA